MENSITIESELNNHCTKCTDESFDACFCRVVDIANCYKYRFKSTNENKYINNKGIIKDDCEYLSHN